MQIEYSEHFWRVVSKIKNQDIREKILKQVRKIAENPDIGKPMKHARKGTREVYIHPFRLSYAYNETEEIIYLLDFYHKDEQ